MNRSLHVILAMLTLCSGSIFAAEPCTGKLAHAETGHDNSKLILSSAKLIESTERKAILDALRPQAASQAGQAVRIKVDRLNISNEWAILVGDIVASEGQKLDWLQAKDCDADLDKMLWVILNKTAGQWRVKEMTICASEPPWWYFNDADLTLPCEVYAGLESPEEGQPFDDLAARCRAFRTQHSVAANPIKNAELSTQQKREVLRQFQLFQQALKTKNIAAVKSFIVFPLQWEWPAFWPEQDDNPPEAITEAIFDKHSADILQEMRKLSSIPSDVLTLTIKEYRDNALSAKEQSRNYHPADGSDENRYYYEENGQKHFVNGTCDAVARAEFTDDGLFAGFGSGSNKQLPGLSELCEHSTNFEFVLLNNMLRLKSVSYAG
uniref:hypothetical protein n=1 Tax=Klebsiella sp. TaxID=576 RepID=UPI002586B6FE|nr:hypothetical protein [Klebsiella sp.]